MISKGTCRKSSAPMAASVKPNGAFSLYGLEGIEGSQSAGDQKISHHDHNRSHRHCRGERNIPRSPLIRIDCLPDEEARIPERLWDDKVSEGQGERENGTRDNAGERQRQDHVAEGLQG